MGASASLEAGALLTKEEAMAAAGDEWDDAKWEAAEKDAEGKVKAEQLLAFVAAASDYPWQDRFAVIGNLSVSSVEEALSVITTDAKKQVECEARAPFFSVFGVPTAPPAGNDAPPEPLTKDKLAWIALFSDFDAYHDGEHEGRTAVDLKAAMEGVQLTKTMMDFAGGFRGVCMLLEKTAATASSVYTAYTICKAKSPEEATVVTETVKALGAAQATAEADFCRSVVFSVGGDLPPQFQDQVTVYWVSQWASAEAYAAAKATDYFTSADTKIKGLCETFAVVEYANTQRK